MAAALAARHEGARVGLVEQEGRLGGDYTYYGCVPSKSLIDTAKAVFEARRLASEGVLDIAPGLEFRPVHERQRSIVREIGRDERDERDERFTSLGIVLVRGLRSSSGRMDFRSETQACTPTGLLSRREASRRSRRSKGWTRSRT